MLLKGRSHGEGNGKGDGEMEPGEATEGEDIFTGSEGQAVRTLMSLGKRGKVAGKVEKWGLGWGGTKKGDKAAEKRGGRPKERGPG